MVLNSQTDLLSQNLLAHKTALLHFHTMLVDALLHSPKVSCDTTGCIHPTTSGVSLPNGGTILISYTLHRILRVDMVFVSCVPASSYDISVLHGQTFVLSNDSSALSCPISGRTFFIRDLANTTFTNANTKLLDERLLFYDNVWIPPPRSRSSGGGSGYAGASSSSRHSMGRGRARSMPGERVRTRGLDSHHRQDDIDDIMRRLD